MGDKKKKSGSGSDFLAKAISIVIISAFTLYVCGHLSAVINTGDGMADLSGRVMEHITSAPLDFMHVNQYVAYFVGLAYILVIVIALSKQTMPRAEMKGEEHGSNDFQTAEERQGFLANNTTPIFQMDINLRKGGGPDD